jgi:hypothetical protein
MIGETLGDIRIVFGSDGGEFPLSTTVPLANFFPQPDFKDINGDGLTDFAVGTSNGFTLLLGQKVTPLRVYHTG